MADTAGWPPGVDRGLDALVDSAALVDAGAPELVRATGGDRIGFLHRLMTADLQGLPVGAGRRALLLDVKAHVTIDAHVFRCAEDLRLVVPQGQATTAAATLTRYAIMDDFTATPDPDWRCVRLIGPKAASALAAAGVAVPSSIAEAAPGTHADLPTGAFGLLWVVRARALGRDAIELWAPPPATDAIEAALLGSGVPRLAPNLAEAARILAGEPRWGVEITDEHFPMEVGLSSAIDYTKGCYLGQEPIVRIRDRGHVNWRLARLRFSPGAPEDLATGTPLETDARPRAGALTSVAKLPGGDVVALARVHASVAAGGVIRARTGTGTATTTVIELDAS
jgi:folate-binding protein YgfZ